MNKTFRSGFTLIELIVVIAIIAVLAGLIIPNITGARQRANDAERKADLRSLQTALETYKIDVGTYPASLPTCNSNLMSGTTSYGKVPCDPAGSTTPYYYCSNTTSVYMLRGCLENSNDKQRDAAPGNPAPPTGCGTITGCTTAANSYSVTNP